MRALRVHQHVDPRHPLADVVHALRRESPVHRAVPSPQQHRRVAQLVVRDAEVGLVRVDHHAVVQAHAEVAHGGVASEVLVGEEQHLPPSLRSLRQRPRQRSLGVAGRAHSAAVASAERLDVGRGVHVRHRDDVADHAGVLQSLPRLLDLLKPGHVGHRAPCGQVGKHDLLAVRRQDVGALGHEVHAAEDDVLGLGTGGSLAGELERVAQHVGELDDLVALVVVTQHEQLVAERLLGAAGAVDEVRVAGRRQVAGTLDAALAERVGAASEQQQGQSGASGGGVCTHDVSIVAR